MKKPETKFRAKFVEKLKTIPYSWFESIQQKTIRGTPDIIGCINGYFVALEIKSSDSATVSKMQTHKLMQIMRANGMGMLVTPDNEEMVILTLRELASEVPSGR